MVHVQDAVGGDVNMEELGALFKDNTELSMQNQEAEGTINKLCQRLEERRAQLAAMKRQQASEQTEHKQFCEKLQKAGQSSNQKIFDHCQRLLPSIRIPNNQSHTKHLEAMRVMKKADEEADEFEKLIMKQLPTFEQTIAQIM